MSINAARRKCIHDAMVRLADGDRGGVPALVEHLWPVLLAFAQRGLASAADAEDVAQEVFLRLCSRISEFDRTRDGLSWVFGIASYEIKTVRQRARRRREDSDTTMSSAVDPRTTQEDDFIARDLVEAVREAVGELTPEDQQALGVGADDDAGAASPAERKRKQRALARLRVFWRQIHG